MNLREEARKLGGEEMVKKVDEMKEQEARFAKRLNDLIEEAKAEAGDTPEKMASTFAALNEAMSEAYARSAMMYGESGYSKTSKVEVIVMAIRSIHGNIEEQYVNLEAEKNGVSEKIMATFKARRDGE